MHEVGEVVLVDNPDTPFLNQALEFLQRTTPPGERVFRFTQQQMGTRFKQAAVDAKVTMLALEPYQMRHTGPSHDFAMGLRSISAVKDRGRWACDASVKRYKKEGRVGQQLARLAEPVRREALRASHLVSRWFGTPSDAPWPARADRASRRSY